MPSQPLYLITDGGELRLSGALLESVEQALCAAKGRVFAVQLREQSYDTSQAPASDSDVLQIAKMLLPVCRKFGSKLIVNSRVDLAYPGNFDGVHLGSRSLGVSQAREMLGSELLIGYSAHSVEEMESISGVDYFFYSPVFQPCSPKAVQREAIGCKEFAKAVAKVSEPVFALGGITVEDVQQCRESGAAGVAVISAVFRAASPVEAVRRLLEAWDG